MYPTIAAYAFIHGADVRFQAAQRHQGKNTYAVAAWLLIEVTATNFPMLKLPEWTATFVAVLLMIGFPVPVCLPGKKTVP